MKRIIIFTTIALFCLQTVFADKIILRNADIIEGEIILIGDENLKYRKPGENFDREIAISNIFKIKFNNGEEQIFKKTQVTTPKTTSSTKNQLIQTEPDWNSMPQASRTYQVGDWFSENGVEGIVIWTTEDGRHGRIIHHKNFYTISNMPKAFFTGPTDIALGMNDKSNGYANLQAVKNFIANNPQYPLSMFPMLEDLLRLGDGWYLPSIEELIYFEMLCNRDITVLRKNHKYEGKTIKCIKLINYTSKAHGGDKINTESYKLSSTEDYSNGGAAQGQELLYGYPVKPQFALYIRETSVKNSLSIRNRPILPIIPFHLF